VQFGHCEHSEGCLEDIHDLLISQGFKAALNGDDHRKTFSSAFPLVLGICVGFFGAFFVSRWAPTAATVGDWVDERFNFGVIMRNLRSTVVEKRLRSLTNACVTFAAVAAMSWFIVHTFPFVITYVYGHHRSPRSNFIWKILRNAPVVNESFIVIELILVSIVVVIFTAMLHFTGMFKWMRTLLAKLWYDCFFALHGDPVDNNTQRKLVVEMDILRRDTKASLGGAKNIAEATTHARWAHVRDATMRRRDELHRAATEESQRIAVSMKHVIGENAVRRVRDALHDEFTFVDGVRTKVKRLLRVPGV